MLNNDLRGTSVAFRNNRQATYLEDFMKAFARMMSVALAAVAIPVFAAGPTQAPAQAPSKAAATGQAPTIAMQPGARRTYSYEPGATGVRTYSYQPGFMARRYVRPGSEAGKNATYKTLQQYGD
jgi:hypothetical protein